MTTKKSINTLWARYVLAWSVHAFTASAAYVGVLTLFKIYQHEFIQALALMGLTIAIDAIDGTLARKVGVKEVLPNMDGALLDNIVDFLNYVITPCFFLLIKPNMLPNAWSPWVILAITLSSSYQFCQNDAKTFDHFFKGFPCYWNFAVFYLFIFNTTMNTNALILTMLCILIFIPIKYVYPSRLDYLFTSRKSKVLMHGYSLLFGISSLLILWNYPYLHPLWLGISLSYVIIYLILSFYRTFFPVKGDLL